MERWLRSHGHPVPPPIPIQLLIDTGADTTTVAAIHMRSLGIDATGAAPVRTITTDVSGESCDTYGVSLQIRGATFGDRPHVLGAVDVIGRPFHNEGFDGLLGRDVLSTLVVTLDGPGSKFIVRWS